MRGYSISGLFYWAAFIWFDFFGFQFNNIRRIVRNSLEYNFFISKLQDFFRRWGHWTVITRSGFRIFTLEISTSRPQTSQYNWYAQERISTFEKVWSISTGVGKNWPYSGNNRHALDTVLSVYLFSGWTSIIKNLEENITWKLIFIFCTHQLNKCN